MPSNIEEAKQKVQDLELQVYKLDLTGRQLEHVAYRGLAVMRHLGLPENITNAIVIMERGTTVARQLSMSLTFLEMNTLYGTVMGPLGIAIAALSFGDLVYDMTRGH